MSNCFPVDVSNAQVTIRICEQKLTDGSTVYDVAMVQHQEHLILLPAYSQKDAAQLATQLQELIEKHTTQYALVLA